MASYEVREEKVDQFSSRFVLVRVGAKLSTELISAPARYGDVAAAMVRVAGELLAADAKVDKQVAQAELYMGKLKDMLHSSFSMGGGQVAVGESVVPLPHETCPECQAVKTIGKPCQVCEMLKGPGAC